MYDLIVVWNKFTLSEDWGGAWLLEGIWIKIYIKNLIANIYWSNEKCFVRFHKVLNIPFFLGFSAVLLWPRFESFGVVLLVDVS